MIYFTYGFVLIRTKNASSLAIEQGTLTTSSSFVN